MSPHMLCHFDIQIMLPLNHRHYHKINGKKEQMHVNCTQEQQNHIFNDNVCKSAVQLKLKSSCRKSMHARRTFQPASLYFMSPPQFHISNNILTNTCIASAIQFTHSNEFVRIVYFGNRF